MCCKMCKCTYDWDREESNILHMYHCGYGLQRKTKYDINDKYEIHHTYIHYFVQWFMPKYNTYDILQLQLVGGNEATSKDICGTGRSKEEDSFRHISDSRYLWEQISVHQHIVALIAPLTWTKSIPPKMVDPFRFWQVWKLLQYLALDYLPFSFMLYTNMCLCRILVFVYSRIPFTKTTIIHLFILYHNVANFVGLL